MSPKVPILKADWEIELQRKAGKIVARVLQVAQEMAEPGVTTADIDRAAERLIRSSGGVPTFLGYRGFPAHICTSINEEVVHGIPSRRRILKAGDLLSVDVGVTYKGYVADAAITVPVGKVSPRAETLLQTTREALSAAIDAVKPGGRLRTVCQAVQHYAESRGYSVVKKFVGHGVGQNLHEEPQVPNFVDPSFPQIDMMLKPGLVIAIEPMLCEGTGDVHTLADGWTVVTTDGGLSAHFEHTVAVRPNGVEILTLP